MRNGVERRKRAIERLEAQLKAGVKPEFIKEGKKKIKTGKTVQLSDTDKERIKKELETLKSRV
jgi:hypothetical protein